MLFSYSWLQSFFRQELPSAKKLAELLTLRSFEVEQVLETKKGSGRFVLDINILPNRAPDASGHYGIAREIAAITGFRFSPLPVRPLEDKRSKTKELVKIKVASAQDCPRYTSRVVSGVKVDRSPQWLVEWLQDCRVQPINNIVDITNYVMLQLGQPLHAFDLDQFAGNRSRGAGVVVRRAKGGEKIRGLDGKTYTLDEDILVIADVEKPLAIAGIKGGQAAEIGAKTKNIILESANFNPTLIRRSSQKLNLKTDASWRFERGIDPSMTKLAIDRAAALIQQIAGGQVASGLADFYPKKVLPNRIKFDIKALEKLLGFSFSNAQVIRILKSLGFRISASIINNQLSITIPTFRRDISGPHDLIEELGRIKGFYNIPAVRPVSEVVSPKTQPQLALRDKAEDVLAALDFTQVYNYSFLSEKIAGKLGWSSEALIELANPLSSEQKFLRPSLIPGLLGNVVENLKFFEQVKLFELGKVYLAGELKNKKPKPATDNQKPLELANLAAIVATKNNGSRGFYALKGALELLLKHLGILSWHLQELPRKHSLGESGASLLKNNAYAYFFSMAGEIMSGKMRLGILGETSYNIVTALDIPARVFVFELDFETLSKLAQPVRQYQAAVKYPAVLRDVAVVVPLATKAAEVLKVIEKTGGKLAKEVELFDIYESKKLGAGKKNLAFHIRYQAQDRTLSSKTVERIQDKVIKALERNRGWRVRK